METLYFGGPILTMDPDRPAASALLTKDGVIAALGTREQLSALAPQAAAVDLQGHALLPGFVDGHSHFCNVGLNLQRCDLIGCGSFAELLQRIRDFRTSRNLVHGEILSCRGYDPDCLAEHRHPTAQLLDSLGFDNPILCLHQSGHLGVCNTPALERYGIQSEDGLLAEGRLFPVSGRMNQADDRQVRQAILDAQEIYLAQGITTAQDICNATDNHLPVYEALAREGLLKLDVLLYLNLDYDHPDCAAALAQLGNRQYHNHLKLAGLKIFLDGSPQARTAWMRQPYEGETTYRGEAAVSDETLRTVLTYAVERDLQPIAHCNGDAACEQYLRVWEQVIREQGHGAELRPIMIHAQTVGDDQLRRMTACGMAPSFFVGHCWYWGDVHRKNLGSRGLRVSPLRSALDLGLTCSLHQDSPVTPVNMVHSIHCAVNRRTKSGFLLGPEQRISVREALDCATHGGAWTYFEEGSKGRLAPGFRADLTILDRDPLAVAPEELENLRVLAAVKDGVCRFSREFLHPQA